MRVRQVVGGINGARQTWVLLPYPRLWDDEARGRRRRAVLAHDIPLPPLMVPAHRIPLITCRTIARCLATKPKGRKQQFTFQLTRTFEPAVTPGLSCQECLAHAARSVSA